MATQSPTKRKRPKSQQQRSQVIPSKDDLLIKDLPRGSLPAETKEPQNEKLSDRAEEREQSAGQSTALESPPSLSPVELDAPKTKPQPRPVRESSANREPRFAEGEVRTTPDTGSTKPIKVQERIHSSSREDAPDGPGNLTPSARTLIAEPPPGQKERPIRSAAGTARLTGRTLRFGGDAALMPGQQVELGGRSYEIKPEEAFRAVFWAKSAGLLILTLLAAIGVAYLASGPSDGAIVGVVVNAKTGQIIPNATVALEDGRVARTNEAGIYLFEGAEAAQYVLTASAAGFEPQNGFIDTEGSEFDQLSFALVPHVFASVPEGSDSATAKETKKSEERSKTARSSSERSYGTVELAVDFEGYLVFVDGELYGKNTSELKRMTAGKHQVVLQVEGYEDYTATVTVKARAKSTITVAKSDLTPRIDPIKRSRGKFAEGKKYLDRQQWAAAIRLFNEALEYDANYADAMQYRGWAYLKTDKPTAAKDDFVRAAELYDLAMKYIDAVACAKYLIEIDPKNPANWRRRADYNLALTDFDAAIEDYKKAVSLNKKSLTSRMALAEAYFAAGKYKDAAKEFDRARKLADDPSQAYIRMILAYYNAGEIDDVVKKFRDFSEVATPGVMERLREDPDWLRVLQIVGPEERTKN